jgi:cell wall-associated NlpC family hydrolase
MVGMTRMVTRLVLVGALALGGLAATGAPAGADPSAAAQGAADYAATKVGCPYVRGASGPCRFDDPGLIQAAYASVGITLPHSVAGEYQSTTPVAFSDLEVGDLVFYADPTGAGPLFDAIYEGQGIVIYVATTGTVVHRAPVGVAPIYATGRVA